VNTTKTESGIIKGKLAYMAPEQAEPQQGHLDRRADIFAMGIVLWECLTLKRLITGDAAAAMTKIVDMEFHPPSETNADVPKELDAITLRALERDPTKRYQTAQEMRDALEAYIRSTGKYVREDEIGRLLTGLFSEARDDVRQQIKEHMANLQSARDLLIVNPEDETQAGPRSSPRSTAPLSVPDNPPRLITESSKSMRAVQSNAQRAPEAKGARHTRLVLAIGGALLVVLGLVIGRIRMRPAADGPQTAAASAAAMSAAASARPAVHVLVHVLPEDAMVLLDDAELPHNPFVGSFPKDGLEHRVVATHAGYASETRLVRFDDDVALAFTLQKAPEAGAAATATGRPKTPPGPKRPKLDEDPYR
jgi:hypothetical protein